MISEIQIENYKSIEKLNLPLGKINVFIGENGAGKSNILEVIALTGAAAAEKLDNEFLASRGIRVTSPQFMRPAFPGADPVAPIKIRVKNDADREVEFFLNNDNSTYAKWTAHTSGNFEIPEGAITQIIPTYVNVDDAVERERRRDAVVQFSQTLTEMFEKVAPRLKEAGEVRHTITSSAADAGYQLIQLLGRASLRGSKAGNALASFVIYSPENSALRSLEREGQIEPLGINGEGLLKLLQFYTTEGEQGTLDHIKKSLRSLNWFEDFNATGIKPDHSLVIKDRFLKPEIADFDHKSANEGFFFLLFYFCLFYSELTPAFFAVDNIDASLNPKLCRKLVEELAKAVKNNNKQVILTTHNPAVLDGLNLDDDEQRLFIVSRTIEGKTKIKRVLKPKIPSGVTAPPKLSEMFLRGILGGLPKGF